jgi:hypothetical protein
MCTGFGGAEIRIAPPASSTVHKHSWIVARGQLFRHRCLDVRTPCARRKRLANRPEPRGLHAGGSKQGVLILLGHAQAVGAEAAPDAVDVHRLNELEVEHLAAGQCEPVNHFPGPEIEDPATLASSLPVVREEPTTRVLAETGDQ